MATSIILYGSAKANCSVFMGHFVSIGESSASNSMQVAMVMASQLVRMCFIMILAVESIL